ncbi:SirB2 family protein [Pseudobdellovibrio exovorus]|uniref:Invasion protein n=1 Tax=Pseudobdellovibrio exovorus JSS TaxID=1184267 RepID=M4VPF1_9BACT|nr:hypothetical protein [Pseudobdellovibrio exovorus]AGH94999.1 hypothetical protein A11Q_781 [Pseudobdellovibrio exovorus JSS]
MSYEFYKIMHLTGVILVFTGLVGLLTIKMSGGALVGKTKMLVFASHGVGLLLALVGGFGLMARLGMAQSMPTWIYGKLIIWFILGGAIALIKRKANIGGLLYGGLIAIFLVASYLAVIKPFTV